MDLCGGEEGAKVGEGLRRGVAGGGRECLCSHAHRIGFNVAFVSAESA